MSIETKNIINKYIKDEKGDVSKVVKFYKRLFAWGVTLMVIGCVGVTVCLGLVIFFGIKQSTGFRIRRAGPFIWNILGVAIFSCIISAGVYLYKSSKAIKNGLVKKLKETE